jgi:hypothetical protein
MVFDYLKTRGTAEKLIENFGQDATLTQYANSGTAYNPTRTGTDHTCRLVVTEYADRDVDGTLVLRTDRNVIISTAGLAVIPSKADTLTIGGVAHQIVEIMPLEPGGIVVIWQAQVRA